VSCLCLCDLTTSLRPKLTPEVRLTGLGWQCNAQKSKSSSNAVRIMMVLEQKENRGGSGGVVVVVVVVTENAIPNVEKKRSK
jgi:hypothetical protein